jgi:hypothetical protein
MKAVRVHHACRRGGCVAAPDARAGDDEKSQGGTVASVNMRVAAIHEGLNGPDNQRDMSFEIIVRLANGDVSRLPALAMDLVNKERCKER